MRVGPEQHDEDAGGDATPGWRFVVGKQYQVEQQAGRDADQIGSHADQAVQCDGKKERGRRQGKSTLSTSSTEYSTGKNDDAETGEPVHDPKSRQAQRAIDVANEDIEEPGVGDGWRDCTEEQRIRLQPRPVCGERLPQA